MCECIRDTFTWYRNRFGGPIRAPDFAQDIENTGKVPSEPSRIPHAIEILKPRVILNIDQDSEQNVKTGLKTVIHIFQKVMYRYQRIDLHSSIH